VQHLRHADAVDDVDAEVAGPALVEGGRERFAGRRGQPYPGQGGGRQLGPEHVGEERRAAEEEGRAVPGGGLGDQVGPGGRRQQHARGAGRQREQH
jgi:hypothetical protein